MLIAVAGATGVVGTQVVRQAEDAGHEVLRIARSAGIDLLTGKGLRLTGVDAVIDVSGTSTISARKSIAFFETATVNLMRAAESADVKHYVPLSIVGAARAPAGYYAGKARQEQLVASGSVPWTILRAAQFFEFAEQNSIQLGRWHGLPEMRSQPVAAGAVAHRLIELAAGFSRRHAIEIAGPDQLSMADVLRARLAAQGENRRVVEIALPGAFGKALRDGSILPGPDVETAGPNCADWARG